MAPATQPALDVPISEENGQGESTMMNFIQQHMASILRPFTEHVDQLHAGVGRLTADLEQTTARTTEAHAQLERHGALLRGVREDLDSTTAKTVAAQAGLERANACHEDLETRHGQTLARLTSTEGRLDDTRADVQQLSRSLKDANEGIGRLNAGLGSTDGHIAKCLGPRIEKLAADINTLDSAHQTTVQKLGAAKSFSEGTDQDFRAFLQARELVDRKNKESFDHANMSLSHLSNMLNETNGRLQTHAGHLKTMNTTLRPLKAQVEELSASHHESLLQQRGAARNMLQIQENFDKLDEAVQKLLEQCGANAKEGGKAANLRDDVAMLMKTVKQAVANIDNLDTTMKRQGEQIQGGEKRTAKLEAGQSRLQAQAQQLEQQVGVESVQQQQQQQAQAEEVRAAKGLLKFQAAVNTMSMRERLKQCKSRIDTHDREMEKATSSLQAAHSDLHSKGKRVEALEEELENTKNQVSKLRAGLELTQEYWKGLSGGLRETHRQVNNEHQSMVTPKPPVTLPALPQPPRTADVPHTAR